MCAGDRGVYGFWRGSCKPANKAAVAGNMTARSHGVWFIQKGEANLTSQGLLNYVESFLVFEQTLSTQIRMNVSVGWKGNSQVSGRRVAWSIEKRWHSESRVVLVTWKRSVH